MEEDNKYSICTNFQEKIIKAVDSRKRKSDQLNLESRTLTNFDNTTLTVVFINEDNDVKVEHTIYNNASAITFDNNAAEVRVEVKKNQAQIDHRHKFLEDILNIGYRKGYMIFLFGRNKTA